MSSPSTDNTGLDITKDKQSYTHNANTPVQRGHDLGHDEVWNQWNEPAHKVSNGESKSADPGLVAVWRSLTVVECKQKLEQPLVRSM